MAEMNCDEVAEFELDAVGGSLLLRTDCEGMSALAPGVVLELLLHVAARSGRACLRQVRIRCGAVPQDSSAFLVVSGQARWVRLEFRSQRADTTHAEVFAYGRIAADDCEGDALDSQTDLASRIAGQLIYDELRSRGLIVPESQQCIHFACDHGSFLDCELSAELGAKQSSNLQNSLRLEAGFHAWQWRRAREESAVPDGSISVSEVCLRGELSNVRRVNIASLQNDSETVSFLDDHSVVLSLRGVDLGSEADSPFMSDALIETFERLGDNRTIKIDDNLFRIGCSSLDVMRLQQALRHNLGLQIETEAIYQCPIVRDLACVLRRPTVNGSESPLPLFVPLTRAQAQLLLIEEEQSLRGLYNELFVFAVVGDLDPRRTQLAFDLLIGAHPSLRTVFVAEGGIRGQRVEPRTSVPVQHLVREADIKQVARVFAEEPFDLESGPLLRVAIVSSTTDEHVSHLVVVAHHSIIDDWSASSLLMRDLASAYISASVESKRSHAREFLDHAWGEYMALRDGVWSEDLAWWQAVVGPCTLMDLPRAMDRGAASDRAGHFDLSLDDQLWKAVRALAHRCGTTPHTVILACLLVAASRFANSSYLAIGVPAANRANVNFYETVGMFTNLLPVALGVDLSLNVSDWVACVAERLRECLSRQHVPFAEIVRTPNVFRDGRSTPLIEIALLWRTHEDSIHLDEATLTPVDVPSGRCKFDIELHVEEKAAAGVRASVRYRRDLFEAESVRSFASALEQFVRNSCGSPLKQLGQVRLVSEAESERMVSGWNDTSVPFSNVDAFTLFSRQASRTPDATAIVWGDSSVRYRDLLQDAHRARDELLRRGIGHGARVGLYTEREPRAIAAILGVLAAGSSYVPLDRTLPVARLRTICLNAGVVAIIGVEARVWEREIGDVEIIDIDELFEVSVGPSSFVPTSPIGPEDVAYILHTSGSTGDPKGVLVPHRVVASLVCWAGRIHGDDELAGVLASTSFAFDMSVFEIFAPLSLGGTLVLVDSILDLATCFARDRVRLVNTVPTALRQLLRARAIPESVRCVNSAGEPLSRDLVDRLYAETKVIRVNDVYGPTETNCVTLGEREPGGVTHIGRPLANATTYLLDDYGQPVPVGAVGELWIGGPSVALGYLGSDPGNAARFVPDHFRGMGKLYRSGDLGRHLDDGRIQLLGRKDRQVKVRGLRIELEEVEFRLARHPAILDCAVEVTPSGAGLGAVVVKRGGEDRLDLTEIRAWISASLPAYVAPDQLVDAREIPRTRTGKVDRTAVRRMLCETPQAWVDARDDSEARLSALWQRILKRDRISVEATLSELGADSLAVAEFVHAAAQAGLQLAPSLIYECQTVATLSARLSTSSEDTDISDLMIEDCRLAADRQEHSRGAHLLPANAAAASSLLTGATGFLGTHMLAEIVRSAPGSDVYCLVRGVDEADARSKLIGRVRHYGAYLNDEGWRRVRVVVGDLEHVGSALRGQVPDTLGAVYHVGASVDFARPYVALRKTNALGTAELLRFAIDASIPEFHHISTLGLSGSRRGSMVPWRELRIGYLQTKWVAEQLAIAAGKGALSARIYRPGRIVWDSRCGAMAVDDLLVRVIRDIVALRVAFDPGDLVVDHMAAVDRVAASTVALAMGRPTGRQHIVELHGGTLPVRHIWDWLRSAGYDFDEVPYSVWRARVLSAGRSSVVLPVISVLGDRDAPNLWNVPLKTDLADLEDVTQVPAEGVNPEGFARMLQWLIDADYLPEPAT